MDTHENEISKIILDAATAIVLKKRWKRILKKSLRISASWRLCVEEMPGMEVLTQSRKGAECRREGLGMHENEISKIILDAATAIVPNKGGKGF